MSIIDKLATSLGRKDDAPNKDLAKAVISENNSESVKELIANLSNSNPDIITNCLDVLEWISNEKPELVSSYAAEIIPLVRSKNNRHVWQSMIVLAKIAELSPAQIWDDIETIIELTNTGSVITSDNGIKILSKVSNRKKEYEDKLFPLLMEYLNTCRPKSTPQYAESIFVAVNKQNKDAYINILQSRVPLFSGSGRSRLLKLLAKAESI